MMKLASTMCNFFANLFFPTKGIFCGTTLGMEDHENKPSHYFRGKQFKVSGNRFGKAGVY